MSLEQLLSGLSRCQFAQQLLNEGCLERSYAVDELLQDTKQALALFYMAPRHDGHQLTVLDVALQPLSQRAQQHTLERFAWPRLAYTVSTSDSRELAQHTDRTKVLFRPSKPGEPVVDASQEYCRFDLINAVFALEALRDEAQSHPSAVGDFFLAAAKTLLPGGHLLLSMRAFDTRSLDRVRAVAALAGLAPLVQLPSPLTGLFHASDHDSPYKRVNLFSNKPLPNEQSATVALLHYFIVFVRS